MSRIDRRGILSAKGAERGGGPHYAGFVRNDGVFLWCRDPRRWHKASATGLCGCGLVGLAGEGFLEEVRRWHKASATG